MALITTCTTCGLVNDGSRATCEQCGTKLSSLKILHPGLRSGRRRSRRVIEELSLALQIGDTEFVPDGTRVA